MGLHCQLYGDYDYTKHIQQLGIEALGDILRFLSRRY